ncbi:MAG: alpha-N-acetylglucosaminidase [Clostridiales bacterium]|nr:alpha-N-acetylglucosaminidase [Clostridiales bacterium]
MDSVVLGFLERNLPEFVNDFNVIIVGEHIEFYCVTTDKGIVTVEASNYILAFCGIYDYLKKYCGVQLSWCANRTINIKSLKMFDGELKKIIKQKYRVYMNYCTLDYSMCWWDFSRWEKEIDFMAMNGINMPLAVVGTEAVWFETLLDFGFSEKEALSAVSGPAFWAWQLMTNIEGYLPPKNKKYIYERLELGRKILKRYDEFGMNPIQQGFSGHVPMLLKNKYPAAKILNQRGWCGFPETAQIDPLDPLFKEFGKKYLSNLSRLMGFRKFIACDPFHEGTPPKPRPWYLKSVGKAIHGMYEEFDENSVWVMQSWSMRKAIVKAVPKHKLLILDINSAKTEKNKNMWGYPVVAGMLHNFGGKNAMQGKIKKHCQNIYYQLESKGAYVVGSGLFMEGINQNPVVYDLQFELLTENKPINCNQWIDNYISRRYGKYNKTIRSAWEILLETCYRSDGYEENAVGSSLASRPQMHPVMAGPCCYVKPFYDIEKFERAVTIFLSVHSEFEKSDGYQYDACDLTRQALSNRFYKNQLEFESVYLKRDLKKTKEIAAAQLEILLDIDKLLSHRSEMCFSGWICDAHNLASDDEEKKYFDFNARTLVTLWGDINSDLPQIYDYSWREWSGLIKEYYYPRWKMFYDYALNCLEKGKVFDYANIGSWGERKKFRLSDLGEKLFQFEKEFAQNYSEYEYPRSSNTVPAALELIEKWNIKG